MLLQDVEVRQRLVDRLARCEAVSSLDSDGYSEAETLVYVFAEVEELFHRIFVDELPQLLDEAKSQEEVCEGVDDLRLDLEHIFMFLQYPRSYQTFVYPIERT